MFTYWWVWICARFVLCEFLVLCSSLCECILRVLFVHVKLFLILRILIAEDLLRNLYNDKTLQWLHNCLVSVCISKLSNISKLFYVMTACFPWSHWLWQKKKALSYCGGANSSCPWFLSIGHLPLVSGQSRLSDIMRWYRGLCTYPIPYSWEEPQLGDRRWRLCDQSSP